MAANSNEDAVYQKCLKVIADLTSDVLKCNDSEIVAFIGATKSGKSTLINCLLRNPLQIKFIEDTEENILVNDDSLGIENCPKIGVGAESETYKPAPYSALPGTKWPMWDFPGFGDNKGIETEIANAINIQTILKQAQSVRFVLVVPVDQIKSDDPMGFFTCLNELYTISRSIQNHVCLVATKGTKGKLQLLLEKKVEVEMKNSSEENTKIVDGAKEILKHVLENKTYFHFKSPKGEHDSQFDMADAPELLEIIKRTSGLKLFGKTGTPLSDNCKLYLTKCYLWFSAAVYSLSQKYAELINDYTKNKIEISHKLSVELKKSYLTERIVEFTDIFNLSDITEIINKLDLSLDLKTSEDLDWKTKFINTIKVLDAVAINAGEEVTKSLDSLQNKIKQCLIGGIIEFSKLVGVCNEEIKKRQIELHNLKEKGEKLDEESKARFGTKTWQFICENKSLIFNAFLMLMPWGRVAGLAGKAVAAPAASILSRAGLAAALSSFYKLLSR